MSDSSHSPPPLDGRYIVGPLLVASALSWALWGVLSVQLAFFIHDVRGTRRRRRKSSAIPPSIVKRPGDGDGRLGKQAQTGLSTTTKNSLSFGFRRQRRESVRKSGATFADDDVNPWKKPFAPPAPSLIIGAFPSSHQHDNNSNNNNTHARQRSSRSTPSSFDPYSPTAVHPSPLDVSGDEAHSIVLPSSSSPSFSFPTNASATSVCILLLLCAIYILVCASLVLATAQFWRVAVDLWNTGSPLLQFGDRWLGLVLADAIGPIIFMITVAYFIYTLYFSPASRLRGATANANTNGGMTPALRPLSLVNAKNKCAKSPNVLPDPYSYPFPQSPSSTIHSNSHHHTFQDRRGRGGRLWSWHFFWHPRNFRLGLGLLEPVLLGSLAIVVGVCGFVECARSFTERPLGEPVKMDAVSLIWYAGSLAIDLVLFVLLLRSFGDTIRRSSSSSWLGRILCVLGEAGGSMLLVAFIALVLAVAWRGGNQRSTLTMVAPSLLPGVYANTVVLHLANTYRRRSSSFLNPDLREDGPASSSSRIHSKEARKGKYEDIEMGLRPQHLLRRNTPVQTRVDLDLGAAASAGSTFSSTADSSGAGLGEGAALRERALAYGRERGLIGEKDNPGASAGVGAQTGPTTTVHKINTNLNLNTATPSPPQIAITGAGMAGNTGVTETVTEAAKAAPPPPLPSSSSMRSGISGALSLELPTFRKGRSYRSWRRYYGYGPGGAGYGAGPGGLHGGYDDEFDDDDEDWDGEGEGSEEWDDELDVDSDLDILGDVGNGTWDYGFANAERERERERAAAAATLLAASSTNANANGNASGSGGGNKGNGANGGNVNMSERTRINAHGGANPNANASGSSSAAVGASGGAAKRNSYPSRSRPSSWRRSALINSTTALNAKRNDGGEGDEDDDKVSMLSGVSSRSRKSRRSRTGMGRGRHSFYANANANHPSSAYAWRPRPLPRTPGMLPPIPMMNGASSSAFQSRPAQSAPSAASISSDSVYLTGAGQNGNRLSSPAGSVLVIGRPREASIAERGGAYGDIDVDVDGAVSVAATRASTGSLWSTFSYRYPYGAGGYPYPYPSPRPVQLPDLDADLQNGAGGGVREEGEAEDEHDRDHDRDGDVNVDESLALGSGVTRRDARSPHPYSAAAAAATAGVHGDVGTGTGEEGEGESPVGRRRWNVHPLKRIADMGRLRS